MFKKLFFVFLFFILLLPINKIKAEETNAGFVPANIWYSKDPFLEGDKIKIYTLVFNPGERELSGTVSFFNKDVLLGKKDFSVASKGVKDISIDWTTTAGSHIIFAKIENAKFLTGGGSYEDAHLEQNQTEESRRSVSKKIILTKPENKTDAGANIGNDKKIQNFVLEKTPNFISEPILGTLRAIEKWRQDNAFSAENKKDKTKMYGIFAFILKSKILFYGVSIFIIFLLVRYIWHKIFL